MLTKVPSVSFLEFISTGTTEPSLVLMVLFAIIGEPSSSKSNRKGVVSRTSAPNNCERRMESSSWLEYPNILEAALLA